MLRRRENESIIKPANILFWDKDSKRSSSRVEQRFNGNYAFACLLDHNNIASAESVGHASALHFEPGVLPRVSPR